MSETTSTLSSLESESEMMESIDSSVYTNHTTRSSSSGSSSIGTLISSPRSPDLLVHVGSVEDDSIQSSYESSSPEYESITDSDESDPDISSRRSMTIEANDELWMMEDEDGTLRPILTRMDSQVDLPPESSMTFDEMRVRRAVQNVTVHPRHYCQQMMCSLDMVQQLTLKYVMQGHEGCVNCLNFNPSGNRLVSGSDDLKIIVWDWAVNKIVGKYATGHRWNVFQSKFLYESDDKDIVTCSRDGQVRIVRLHNDSSESCTSRRVAAHTESAHKLALCEYFPNLVLSCGEDGQVFEIDVRKRKPNSLFTVNNDRVVADGKRLYSIDMNPRCPNEFLVCGDSAYCNIYDRRNIRENAPLVSFKPNSFSPIRAGTTAAKYNHTGTEVIASYRGSDIFLFDVSSMAEIKTVRRYQGHRNSATIKGVDFYGPGSRYVVSGSDCGHIFFWDKETAEVIKFMHGDDSGVVNVLESNPSCSVLATSGLDHEVKLWEPSGEPQSADFEQLRRIYDSNRDEWGGTPFYIDGSNAYDSNGNRSWMDLESFMQNYRDLYGSSDLDGPSIPDVPIIDCRPS